MPRPRRLSRRIALLGAGALAAAPRPARAHAILESSDPPAKGVVAAGRVAFRLKFNSRIDAERSVLTLVRPDKSRAPLGVAAGPTPDVLTAAADLAPGPHALRWQVLAEDGHITRGEFPFSATGR